MDAMSIFGYFTIQNKTYWFGSYGRGLGPHVTFILRADKSAFFSKLQKDIHFCSDLKEMSHVAFINIDSFQHSNAEQPKVIFLEKSDCCGAGWMRRSVFCSFCKVEGTWKWGTHDEAWGWGWACVIVDRHIKSVSPKTMCVWGRWAPKYLLWLSCLKYGGQLWRWEG